MAHKIGQSDTLYEPDISGEVDFSFYEDDNDVDRTKGCETVSGSAFHSVIGSSSSPPSASCLVDSRYRCVEDTSSGGQEASRRCQGEGRQGSEEVLREEDSGASVSSGGDTPGKVGSAVGSLEAHQQGATCAVMEHVDPNPYSSDEWEESDLSDTDGDHSDSSDDDDPKSQVDRLIERGTLVYMDGENSNLSSEDSSDSSDYDDSDSESDITDVSPLISATASPLGLSPVLPRRTLGTSPLALHDNRDLGFNNYHPENSSNDQGYNSQPHCNGYSNHSHSDDSTDMTALLEAVAALERKQHRHVSNRTSECQLHNCNDHHSDDLHHHHHHQSAPITIHPIDASPHHRHLRKNVHHRRKNMSFTNEEVRRIDRENRILLQKIMSAHDRSKHPSSSNNHNSRPVHKPANSTVNRKREDEKIRRENAILLRKIQEARPSRDIAAFRSPRQRASHGLRPTSNIGLATTPGSCGASARTAPGHVATPTPRKETAL